MNIDIIGQYSNYIVISASTDPCRLQNDVRLDMALNFDQVWKELVKSEEGANTRA